MKRSYLLENITHIQVFSWGNKHYCFFARSLFFIRKNLFFMLTNNYISWQNLNDWLEGLLFKALCLHSSQTINRVVVNGCMSNPSEWKRPCVFCTVKCPQSCGDPQRQTEESKKPLILSQRSSTLLLHLNAPPGKRQERFLFVQVKCISPLCTGLTETLSLKVFSKKHI